jgi:hypothetical protein
MEGESYSGSQSSMMISYGSDSAGSGYESAENSFEGGNEPPGSVECKQILD